MILSALFRRTPLSPVKVFFRRTVPLPEKEATSWLGGLPKMPEDISWPCQSTGATATDGKSALHFLAQIDCADLPSDHCGGLLPEIGSLLFFANMFQGFDEDLTSHDFRVIYVEQVGPERGPPNGIRPIHDPDYSGFPFHEIYGPPELWPRVFRKWPVDVIPVTSEHLEPTGGKSIEGYYEAPSQTNFEPESDALLAMLADKPLTYGFALQLAMAATQKIKNLSQAASTFDQEEERFFRRTTADDFWDAEFAKLDKMEAENREKLQRYEKEGWVADPAQVPIDQSALSSVTFNLNWVADKRAAFERQRNNTKFVEDMRQHFDVLRESVHWAAGLSTRFDELLELLKKGETDQTLVGNDAEVFRDLVFRQSFTSRRISWVVETKDEVITPLGGALQAKLILREELTDRYLRDRESLKAFPADLENLEQYFRHVTGAHSSGASLHGNDDDIVLLDLVSDEPMQWAFPGRLVFTISPDNLRTMKLCEAKMYVVE